MTPERWQEVSRLYQSALAQPAGMRAAFLAGACRDDSALRREVESLLAQEQAGVLVDQPVGAAAAAVLGGAPGLAPGTVIGPYRVTGLLGAGGMGQVYRAQDTKLQRDVALKILPDAFVHDPDRLARFTREAQVLASLNHPHIGAIYGFEDSGPIHALVLELVEGPTLADRIAAGPVPLDETLAISRQIAEALEAAHEHGIVHRDLKPANIKVRDDGTVKVLDFGLAKLTRGEDGSGPLPLGTQSPTVLSPAMTTVGVILGTAAYMSPEQAKGRPTDKRSDVWAFGCVLYEMLTGKRVFEGDDVTETIAAVVRAVPDWSRLPATTPPPIRRLLRRCLEKNSRERLTDAGGARLEIKEALSSVESDSVQGETAAATRQPGTRLAWMVATAMALVAIALGAAMFLGRAPATTASYRSSILPPATPTGDPPGRLAISPDGRRLAFLAPGPNGRNVVWVRPLDGLTAQPLAGTEDAAHPFWSPDSRFIAFASAGKLRKIDASGGQALALCDSGGAAAGTWNGDVILFSPNNRREPISRVGAGGGTSTPVTKLDEAAGETAHRYPFFLPDGRHFLYVAYAGTVPRAVYVGSLDGSDRTQVMEGGSNVAYAQGFLLFIRDGTLMAQPFDTSRLTLTGEAVPLDPVLTQPARAGAFSVAQTGELVYIAGELGRQLQWVNRDGKLLRTLGERRTGYSDINLSWAGDRAAVTIVPTEGDAPDIWVIDMQRGTPMRFTLDPAIDQAPTWAPGDTRITFQSNRNKGNRDVYERASSGAGADDLLLADNTTKTPTSWSKDGDYLLYNHGGTETVIQDIWVLPTKGDRKPFPFQNSRFMEADARFSPDGRWVAYTSNESGESQVFVAPFPGPGGKWPVSGPGGRFARWRQDGKELFFESRGRLEAAAVSGDGPAFQAGEVRFLFRIEGSGGSARRRWDVHPDGQSFLVAQENTTDQVVPITLVVNWAAGLRR